MDRSTDDSPLDLPAAGGSGWRAPCGAAAVVPSTAAELRSWCAARQLTERRLVELLAELGGVRPFRLRELRGELPAPIRTALRRLAALELLPAPDPAAELEARTAALTARPNPG